MIPHNCSEELRGLSLKATPARLAILQYLESTTEPVDVSSIIQSVKSQGLVVDQATVFRIINIFTEKGLTRQLHLNEGKFRYELSSMPEHHHLVCRHCGRIEDIMNCGVEDFEKRVEAKTHFKIYTHSLEFFGICSDCQK